MPRPRKQSASPQLSSGQASYVLERLISERRVSQGDINRYVAEMGREISALEERLQRLREAHGGKIALAAAGVAGLAGAAAVVHRGRPGRPPGRRGPGRPPAEPQGEQAQGTGKVKRRRKAAITGEQLASRQLQGRYLALVRRFPATKRAQYAKVAREKGREAAIKDMQDALKK